MKILSKQALVDIIVAFFLISCALMTILPFAKAANVPTSAGVTVAPSPVGVGQQVLVEMWVSPIPPTSNVFHNLRVVITKPDGANETLGPFNSDLTGSSNISYIPTQVGIYSAQLTYPGETFNGTGDYYYPCSSPSAPFIVQQEPVQLQLNISSLGSGATNPAFGSHAYNPGDIVSVTAQPNPGWTFDGWLLNGANASSSSRTYTLTMFSNENLTAVFSQILTSAYNLTISTIGYGSTNPAAGVQSYPQSTVVSVNATPASGWGFSYWLLDGSNVSSNSRYALSMNANHTLIAVFELNPTAPTRSPEAVIVSIEPSPATAGMRVTFSGFGNSTYGVITGYRWTSSIDGLLSNSASFSMSTLTAGTHQIFFEVQYNNTFWSTAASQTLVVEAGPLRTLDVVLTATITLSAVSGWVATYNVYFRRRPRRFPLHFVGRPPFSSQVKSILREKISQEQEKEERDKRKEKKKGKPCLELKINVPPYILGSLSYEAKLNVKNTGQNQAENVLIKFSLTPGLLPSKKTERIPVLKPGEERSIIFPFEAAERVKKGVYTLKFTAKSKETSTKIKCGYTRAAKLGFLSNPKEPENADSVKGWLKENSYSWDEVENAGDLIKCLLKYDLLILAPEVELPPQWVQNLSAFVDNSQSLIVIDKVITTEQEVLAETLGYAEMHYEAIRLNHGILRIRDDQSLKPSEFRVGDKITLESYGGNPCVSIVTTGRILVEHLNMENMVTNAAPFSAITINEYGEGKTVHLNFRAENFLDKLNSLLKDAVEWLLL
jgi:hypothetical protein